MTGGMIVKKKYIATIMKKQKIGEEKFIVYCDHAAIGELNEKTNRFIDANQKEYVPMMSEAILDSNYQEAYFNIVDFQKIKGQINKEEKESITPKEFEKVALREFEKMGKKNFYYLGRGTDGKMFCGAINTEEVERKVEQTKQEEKTIAANEEEENAELATLNATGDDEMDQLLQEIIDGKFTEEELAQILSELEISLENIQDIVDLIDSMINKKQEQEKNSNQPVKRIDIKDLYEKVTKTLIAQDEPARRVIAEIARKEMDDRKKKQGILLTGPTGVGKTELMRLIAKYIDRPFYTVNTAQISTTGDVVFIDETQRKPRFIEEVLWDLYVQCGKDLQKTERAIIFFDDIDGCNNIVENSDHAVLDVLLPFISGATYDATDDTSVAKRTVRISTENMTVILGGNYSDVYKSSGRSDLGFLKKYPIEKQNRRLSTKDFIEYGTMTDGFMGRITVIKLNSLDVEGIKRIMMESDESEILIQQKIFKDLGVKLTFTDGYVTKVAKDAAEKKTGARGLSEVIDDTTWLAFDEVYTNPNTYKEIIVDENTIEDPSTYQKIERKPNKQYTKKRTNRLSEANN